MNEDSFDVNYLNYILDHLGLKELGVDLNSAEILKILEGKKISFSSYDRTKKELVYPN